LHVEIGEIDPHDEGQLQAYWSVGHEANLYERPYSTFWSLRAAGVALRGSDPTWRLLPIVARLPDGEIVGVTQVVMPQLDNTHLVLTRPAVLPAYRRNGIGSALLDAVLGLTRREGRTTIVIDADRALGATTSPGWDFLTHRGFTPGQHDVHRVLDLPIDESRLASCRADASPHHTDYRLVQCSDDLPDRWVDGFCRLQEAFNAEAPLGELEFEPEAWNEERLHHNEERRRRQGTWSETTLAVEAGGDVVGLTELTVTDEGMGMCYQGATLVLKAHRGHRLGDGAQGRQSGCAPGEEPIAGHDPLLERRRERADGGHQCGARLPSGRRTG
jgi:GNAT superfamily N-acetyltransferase